jgi:hypothetical protein
VAHLQKSRLTSALRPLSQAGEQESKRTTFEIRLEANGHELKMFSQKREKKHLGFGSDLLLGNLQIVEVSF